MLKIIIFIAMKNSINYIIENEISKSKKEYSPWWDSNPRQREGTPS